MPYIKQSKRVELDLPIKNIIFALEGLQQDKNNNQEGNINYVFSKILAAFYKDKGYAGINAAAGLLSCVSSEFYRKIASPYEDQKEKENGVVY